MRIPFVAIRALVAALAGGWFLTEL